VHRCLDKNVGLLPLLCPRVDLFVVAMLDAKGDLEGVIDSDVTLFIPIGEMDEGAVFRKLQFMVKCPWPWTHDGRGHFVFVLISVQELV
jgi:hypothetical protein